MRSNMSPVARRYCQRSAACLALACLLPCLAAGEALAADPVAFDAIGPLVEQAIERGDLPGCVVMIGTQAKPLFVEAYGNRSLEPAVEPMTIDTVFDLASLTKPIATATCVMRQIERGRLRLRTPVSAVLPGFAENEKSEITVEHLLTHSGGLIPDNPVDDYRRGQREAWRRIDLLEPQASPGQRFIYTDVGFLCLGRIVEALEGAPLDEVARRDLFLPLGMKDTGFNPAEGLRPRIAPTERHERAWLRGTVHDPRARLLKGVAGHAGLFSTAHDLGRFARMMLGRGKLDGARILSPAAVAEMTRPRKIGDARRALGWDSRSRYSTNRGDLMTVRAFGHGGFTGTGLWIDPGLDLYVVFLSNRLHPDGEGSVNDLIGRIGSIAAAAVSSGAEPQ